MAAISAQMVKELRERTGLGMMDCKKALVEAEGDAELAIENLRKSSGMKAAKKAGRTAAEGVVREKLAEDGSFGVLVEVNCETDFAARDENFLKFADVVVDKIFESRDTDIAGLMEAGLEKQREELVQKIGENVSVRRAALIEGGAAGYIHTNNKIGVLLGLAGGDADLGRDIAMHIAASNPQVVSPDDAPAEIVEKEREIYSAQAAESGKPAEIVAKMIDGRIKKFLTEISLLEQPFVKDGDVKVGALVKKAGATVTGFVRYEVGEGIDKEEDDFAAEVARQLGQD
ncbi:MAG TPA: translation elongation factor Ts [Pseudomonadales bacterium]|nr:translation elongation factor Ts [Pseudomonadales bacterium]